MFAASVTEFRGLQAMRILQMNTRRQWVDWQSPARGLCYSGRVCGRFAA